jgi:hypothetical protein
MNHTTYIIWFYDAEENETRILHQVDGCYAFITPNGNSVSDVLEACTKHNATCPVVQEGK